MKVDIAIIGAGVSGAAIASTLSQYDISVCVLEKSNDISNGASKANSGIVHAGYDAKPGTMMAAFNVQGNAMFSALCERLDVPFTRIGSYVVAFNRDDMKTLEMLKKRGEENGVPDLEILSAKVVHINEPHLNPNIIGALFAPTAAVVSPYELSIAFMEHAIDNGVQLYLQSPVQNIIKENNAYKIITPDKEIQAACVINCAGVYADTIHDMVLPSAFHINARRGEYFLLDKYAGDIVQHIIFQCPSDRGKGVLVTPTAHKNIIIGPNAEDILEREAVETTVEGLSEVWKSALKSSPELPENQIITTFSGIRAEPSSGDFIIRDYVETPGFIDVAGIKSPGLSSAPAFALYVNDLVQKYFGSLKQKENYIQGRRKRIHFHELSHEERREIVKKDPLYGRIICRCENITEGEIVDSIHRFAGARTIDGVKRRARCGGGRCQGGFCGPRIIDILARELNIPKEAVCKDSPESRIIVAETKGNCAL